MSSWICMFSIHARLLGGRVVHIERGFRLFFYLKRACEGLKERGEQVTFTLFICVSTSIAEYAENPIKSKQKEYIL